MRALRGWPLAWFLLALAFAIRLLSLGSYPLMDTTEARYGEVARKMAELGDWITPWYDVGVPFWGKPPLAFWLILTNYVCSLRFRSAPFFPRANGLLSSPQR